MALHMMMESSRPAVPFNAPAMISSRLSSTKPMAAAATPAEELSSAITVGMSAPPMGVTSMMPNIRANPMKVGNIQGSDMPAVIATPSATAPPKTIKLTTFWPL